MRYLLRRYQGKSGMPIYYKGPGVGSEWTYNQAKALTFAKLPAKKTAKALGQHTEPVPCGGGA